MGSLFDGIGGFPLGGILNGITPLWASEIEPLPIEVTKERFPDMLHVGDITRIKGADLPPVDIITGGSPCQDLSVAGARAGLAGERSGLFMEQVRIVKEMRETDIRRGRAAQLVRPRYLVWENVPGAFSSAGGEDFRVVLEEICRVTDSSISVPRPETGRWESAGAILGAGFSVAWRILDAQYWGVAQRRRRIYLVADFGGFTAPEILFKQDRLFGDTAPLQSAGQALAAAAGAGVEDSGRRAVDIPAAFHINQREEVIDLGMVSGALLATSNMQMQTFISSIAFAANQRDELRDLGAASGALGAQPGMKQQTFIAEVESEGAGHLFAAGFCAGAAPTAGSIGYAEEISPTLKAGESGTNMVPSILCLNDQGGAQMGCSEDVAGTLRAQEHGHQPLVMATQQGGAEIGVDICPAITSAAGTSGNDQPVLFENHGIDSRYTGPHGVAPTMSARYGTGGNNVPLVAREEEATCIAIAANIIGREPKNGGNGIGYQEEVAYTLTGADRHAVFSRQRVDCFHDNEVVGTQSARQHKDATDLVCEVSGLDCRNGNENGDLCGTLQSKSAGGYSLNNIHPVRTGNLIRRLTPLECERLQGFPDGWTAIPGASDSARYKALGNSVAIPCVDFVLRGIAYFLRQQDMD